MIIKQTELARIKKRALYLLSISAEHTDIAYASIRGDAIDTLNLIDEIEYLRTKVRVKKIKGIANG